MERADRVIFHIDCNAFYASVEEQLHPELKAVPMAICGDPEARRGIILAKNQLAKGFGVTTAETIWQARRKCPDLVLRPARHGLYHDYSRCVNAIYQQYTSQVQPFGIDESYLDVTGSLHLFGGDALGLAHEIRQRVTRETGLTVSVGVSWCKVFAKLASDLKKPDAVSVVSRENYRDVVWPLPVSDLLYVGRSTAQGMGLLGIKTIGQLAAAGEDMLHRRFGKLGQQLHAYANGVDGSPVLEVGESPDLQSVGNGMTFSRDLVTRGDISIGVKVLCDSVASRMRKYGVKAGTVQLTIKDKDLKVFTRQKSLDNPTFLAADLHREAMLLADRWWKPGTPVRMLTVTASKLVPEGEAVGQISLFEETGSSNGERQERLEKTVDKIRGKYGRGAIAFGSVLENDMGLEE